MHIKEKPEDFRVEEVTSRIPGEKGAFAFYRLEKRGWTTPDAIQIIRKRWKLDRQRIAVGGLKDRHAETTQYLTILHGPERKLTHANLQLTYLGKVEEAYSSEQIEANRFDLTVRDITTAQIEDALTALEEVRDAGVPNYYDDQRFGSVVHSGEFFAKQLILGEHEAALRNVLTAPYAFERAAQKKEKSLLRKHWGDWRACVKLLPRGIARNIVTHLADRSSDFRGAIEQLPADLRTLYLSAYQSHLWNHMLADWVYDHFRAKQLTAIHLRLGEVPVPRRLDEETRATVGALQLPLHSARIQFEDADPRKLYFDRVLKDEGLHVEQFKLKGMRKLFFSKGERPAWCFPRDLEAFDTRDDLHPGKHKLILRFELPRGSYATLIVKRLARIEERE